MNQKFPDTKYIFVTGGVISGLGKGTITASVAYLLKSQGFSVSVIKIDPYINVDAGTMRPTEHGETWVTDDGGETDQDLGTYERFLDIDLGKEHNITTGKVYSTVIQKERNLEYDGKCVQVMPHIPLEAKRRIKEIAEKTKADFILVEIGGTVGDYENVLFLETGKDMKLKGEKVLFLHVAFLPIPEKLGEMKTKPAQRSVRDLNAVGIQPDFLVCRAKNPLDEVRKEKMSVFCNVRREDIISSPDADSIYEVPLILEEQNFTERILQKFDIEKKDGDLSELREFIKKIKSLKTGVKIGIIGKYFDIGDYTLADSYISVIESIKLACWNNNVRPDIRWIDSKDFEKDGKNVDVLKKVDAIIIPGGFGSSGIEGKIAAIKFARENNIPFLGLCYGLQLAVIEFARNVCNLKDANSTEINPNTKNPVIDVLPEQKELLRKRQYGASMRLGAYPAVLKENTKVFQLYGKKEISERHRHRYEVNPEFIEILEKNGLVFSGRSPDRKLMEFIELPKHPYFLATQSHPEFKSRLFKPAPLFDGLIKAALKR